MGAAFGLLGLLVTVCIILYMMVGAGGNGGYLGSVSTANKQAKAQVNVISGYDPNRQMLATQSIHMTIDRGPAQSGKPKLIVTEVMKAGPMEDRFGLRANDQIVEIGALDVTMNVNGSDDASAFMHDAYARGWPIVVMRNGQRLTLPTPEHTAMIADRDRKAAAAAAAATNAPAPATPTAPPPGQPEPTRTGLDGLLDNIRSKRD